MEKEKGKKTLTVGIDRNPYRDNVDLFDTDEIAIEPGVTVLCGCNGSGKTTLLGEIAKGLGYRPGGERINRLRHAVEAIGGGTDGGPDDGKDSRADEPAAIVVPWNAVKGRENFLSGAASVFDPVGMSLGFEIRDSSEGEGTMMALGQLARSIGSKASAGSPDSPLVLLIDAVDSGLDEANMSEFRGFIGFLSEQAEGDGRGFHCVVSTNSWPMTQEWEKEAGLEPRCVLVPSLEPFETPDYQTWRRVMLDCAKRKAKRDEKNRR